MIEDWAVILIPMAVSVFAFLVARRFQRRSVLRARCQHRWVSVWVERMEPRRVLACSKCGLIDDVAFATGVN